MSVSATRASADPALAIATAFVEARRQGRSLPGFPGEIPEALNGSYRVQDHAIRLWDDEIVGWKIGRIHPPFEARYGASRLAGPIFSRQVQQAGAGAVAEVFAGGFGAVEGEYVMEVAADAPADKIDWTSEEAEAFAGALRIGVEIASSPLATINDLGPAVVVSDFGNNNGLILGPAVEGWRERALADFTCETFIDDASVGTGSLAQMPGGPLEALRFLLGNAAGRGRPLRKGQWVSTGAVSGVHDIRAGQSAVVRFGEFGEIACTARAVATP